MKPRSLLIRDRSQITNLSQDANAHLIASGSGSGSGSGSVAPCEPRLEQSTKTANVAAAAAAPAVAVTPLEPSSNKRQTTIRSSSSTSSSGCWLEFGVSMLGGSLGAYVILFATGLWYQACLTLSLIGFLLLSESWEIYMLFSSDTKKHNEIRRLRRTKRSVQLRYGQSFLMSAGLARVLTLYDPSELPVEAGTWSVAWCIWSYLFYHSNSEETSKSRRRNKNGNSSKAMTA